MKIDEMIAGEIQGELLVGMMDADMYASVQWKFLTGSPLYSLIQQDPSFKSMFDNIFKTHLGASMDEIVSVSTVTSDRSDILNIIKFIQTHATDKHSVNPSSFNINVDRYSVTKASVFVWNDIKFLVIKDMIPPRDVNYHIYAATQ